jgi:transcriptional regulator
MYDLPYHKEPDERVVNEFISRNPFALLSGCGQGNAPVATQVPLLLDDISGRKTLVGHIMKDTDHHDAFLHNDKVLAVFSGSNTYVSATWYSNPYLASTWNYMSVHTRGVIRFLDEAGTEAVLQRTSLHFENNNPRSPTVYSNLPAAFKQKVLKYIVAFEIEVAEMDTVFKLSQDRDAESYENIIEQLKDQGESGRAIAIEMEQRKAKLFGDPDAPGRQSRST